MKRGVVSPRADVEQSSPKDSELPTYAEEEEEEDTVLMGFFTLEFASTRIEREWQLYRRDRTALTKRRSTLSAAAIAPIVALCVVFLDDFPAKSTAYASLAIIEGALIASFGAQHLMVLSANMLDSITTAEVLLSITFLVLASVSMSRPLLAWGAWFTYSTLFNVVFGLRFCCTVIATTLPGAALAIVLRNEFRDGISLILVVLPQIVLSMVIPRIRELQERRNFIFSRGAKNVIEKRGTALQAMNKKLQVSEEEKAQAQDLIDKHMSADHQWELEMTHFLINYNELTFEKVLGQGAFGLVHRGLWHGQTVAIKTIRVSKVTEKTLRSFRLEIQVMAPLRHNNLVTMYGACWKEGPDKLCLVLEYAGRGSFLDLLKDPRYQSWTKQPSASLASKTASNYITTYRWMHPRRQIIEGTAACLVYMHNLQPLVIHRDLKPDNILVDASLEAKVCDFGVSRRRDETHNDAEEMSIVGTPLFCAPEMFRGDAYNEMVDIYALGSIMIEAAAGDGKYVRRSYAPGTVAASVLLGARPKIPQSLRRSHPILANIISRCWHEDFRKRPAALEVFAELQKVPYDDDDNNGFGGENQIAPAASTVDLLPARPSKVGTHHCENGKNNKIFGRKLQGRRNSSLCVAKSQARNSSVIMALELQQMSKQAARLDLRQTT